MGYEGMGVIGMPHRDGYNWDLQDWGEIGTGKTSICVHWHVNIEWAIRVWGSLRQ